MELSAKRRAETGAFYTPKIRAEKAIEYMNRELWDLQNYIFYDPACGEWALLEALPEEVIKFGTTLEAWDVEICKRRGIEALQMDFLSPESESVLESLANLFERVSKPLVIFTNPPYFKLKADQYPEIKKIYKTNDTVALFYCRLMFMFEPAYICWFNKLDLRQSTDMGIFRERLAIYWTLQKMFITHSKSRPWLKGDFPIAFNILKKY